MTVEKPCPCQSELEYAACCGPYHEGKLYAPDAEKLMRSRYCAYALGKADYLINTTHRENRQYKKNARVWRTEILDYCRHTNFRGLTILEHIPEENTAVVKFEAKLSHDGRPIVLNEKSHFVKLGQRWLYHSGETETTLAK